MVTTMIDNKPQEIFADIFKKPKYDSKLIGVVALDKGSIKEVAAKYSVSRYFVQQSRKLAREYGYRVKGDRISDGEKEVIISESYSGKSAGEISKMLGGVSRGAIYDARKEHSDNLFGYFGSSLSNNIKEESANKEKDELFFSKNLEARVVGRKAGIIRVNMKVKKSRKAVGNGDEVVEGYNVVDARNEAVGGTDDSSFKSLTDEQLKRDYGMDPTAVRRSLKYIKGQMKRDNSEVTDEQVIEAYDHQRYDSLKHQIKFAKGCKSGNPKGSISLLEDLLGRSGAIPAKPKFGELREEAKDALNFVRDAYDKYQAEEAAKKAAQAPAELGTFVNGKPVDPNAPAFTPAEPLLVVPVIEPEGDDTKQGKNMSDSMVAAAAAISEHPELAELPLVKDQQTAREEQNRQEKPFEVYLRQFDSLRNSGSIVESERVYALGEMLDNIGRDNELSDGEKNRLSGLIDSYRDSLEESTPENAELPDVPVAPLASGYKDRAERDSAIVRAGRKIRDTAKHVAVGAKKWYERNVVTGTALALLAIGSITGGYLLHSALSRRMENVEQTPIVLKRMGDVKTYESFRRQVEEQKSQIEQYGRDNAALKERLGGLEGKINQTNESFKRADNENLKLVKDRIDLSDSENKKARDALAAQQRAYETKNENAHKDILDKIGETKVAPVPIPTPAPTPEPTPEVPVGPAIGPETNPTPAPAPQPEGNKISGEAKLRVEALSGDVSGQQARANALFNLNEGYEFGIDALEKTEKHDLRTGEDVRTTTLWAMPELKVGKGNKQFDFKANIYQSKEKMDGEENNVRNTVEAGLPVSVAERESWDQTTTRTLNAFSADVKVDNLRLFGNVGADRSRTSYENDNHTVATIGAMPPIILDNNVKTTTNAKTAFFTLGAGYDFGDVEAGALFRNKSTKWDAESELNGSTIVNEDGSSTQSTGGVYARFNFNDKIAGRAMALVNSGDDLESSQKFEGAIHSSFSLGENYVVGVGGETSDGGAKARGLFLWNMNENKPASHALREANLYMNGAEDANLFPETTTSEQKRLARTDRDMSVAANGLFLGVEGGKENAEQGDYFRLDAGSPIPGTKNKAYVYGVFQDGESLRLIEGGAGYKLNDNLSFGWNYWNEDNKEMEVKTSGTGPTLMVKW